ncbi:MAG TPA: PAS domain S-box protein [Sphingopyxis sp.]|uniref:hybrid sensor histidine kinase/response regulator n=1 Tax=Sphingopyxis sp. TaxID=1908224 RepID=UPI002D0524A1|nr:PAS domain S-box protein [Sphingopyxis sp.]HWW56031.1 PAS domain S-box protein [Sphingopyxis sp.]
MLVDAIKDYAIYMLDPGGFIANWNSGAQRFKGYTADEIVGEHFSRFYTPEDRAVDLPRRALEIARTEGQFEQEGWRVRKNGERFWAHVVIDPIWDEDDILVGFAKITRDLTERRRALETLRESEEQFRMLVQSVTDYAIYRLDPDGHVSSWNAGAERIKGYAPHEIIGSHFSKFYTAADAAAGEPARALALARTEGRFLAEGRRVRKDGSEFAASVVIDPIYDHDGNLAGFAKITRDVSEREERQRELERAREALFQSQKMEAIGQLTGGVAHDFNNLLMAVQSSIGLLAKKLPADPQLKRLIDNALQGVERGAALTQRMLAFARRQDLQTEAIEPIRLIRNMSDLLQRTIGPAHPLQLRLPDRIAAVEADANQLEMAFINLAVNARDAMPDGGKISIAVSARDLAANEIDHLPAGAYVRIDVTDSGKGMDPETLLRATEPFFTTKGVGKGTGLGLSMVHGLAEQMGGFLQLQSRLGSGTTASLWLPALAANDEPEDIAVNADASETSAHHRLKILAVDDDALVLMNTAALLEDLGHDVYEASSGEEALTRFAEHPDIDLLITDQAMPNMTGAKLAETLRAARPDLPIIIASGYGELSEGAPGPLVRLGKPFSQAQLADALAKADDGSAKAP